VFERKVKGDVANEGDYDYEKEEGYGEVGVVDVRVGEEVVKEVCVVYCIAG
jgi:hypothetical protein